jgi:type I restriction enzyme S subunit
MPEELPKGWVKAKLGEVCLPVSTIQPEDSPDAEFTYFDIGGIDNERNRIAETKTVTGRNAPSRARQAVRKDDILFSTVRTYLRKIARVERDYPNPVASTGLTVIRAAEGVSSHFLFFQILSEDFLQPLHALQTGSSYPAVRNRDVFAQPIVLAPAREQKQIAVKLDAALSRMSNGEKAARRALDRLQRYRAAVLHAAATGELTRDWRKAQRKNKKAEPETGKTLLQRLLAARRARWEEAELKRLSASGKAPKDEEWKKKYKEPVKATVIDRVALPEDWVWASADQCTTMITDGEHMTPQRSESGTLLLSARNILDGRLSLEHVDYVPEAEYRRIARRLVIESGDVLLSCSGSVGRSCVAPPNLKFALVRSVAVLKPMLEMGAYLSFALRSPLLQEQISEKRTQTAQANIFQGKIKTLVFPLPPLAEQFQIVHEVEHRLEAADRLAAKLDRQLERARAMRQSLLHEAFAGRLIPQNPKDEPASVLLGHIRAAREAEAQEQKGKRMKTMKKPKSKWKKARRPLLDVLREHKGPMTPEQLFREAGFEASQVDLFYRELTSLRDKLLEQKPKGSEAKLWPHRTNVLLQLKKGAEK